MAKAFNSLNCIMLVQKLQRLGFEQNFLRLMEDYLMGRQQVTNLSGFLSSVGQLNYGVPQGSILGPTLFNVFMNDLPLIFETVTPRMYADDTVLYKTVDLSGKIKEQLEEVNTDLNSLGKWCESNKLTVNVDKSQVMFFVAPRSKYRNYDASDLPGLYLNGSQLSYVNSYKYLGIELDRHLKMELHLKNVLQKLCPIVYKFSKTRYLVDQNTALTIYKSHILPVLEFGLFIMNNYYSGQVEKLQKVQNKCLRVCFRKDNRFPSSRLHLKANLLPLHYRRECCLLSLINKKLIKDDGTFAIDACKSNRARGGSKAVIQFPKVEYFRKSIAYIMPSLWNSLPQNYKENPLPWIFKKKIKEYYLEKYKTECAM